MIDFHSSKSQKVRATTASKLTLPMRAIPILPSATLSRAAHFLTSQSNSEQLLPECQTTPVLERASHCPETAAPSQSGSLSLVGLLEAQVSHVCSTGMKRPVPGCSGARTSGRSTTYSKGRRLLCLRTETFLPWAPQGRHTSSAPSHRASIRQLVT